MSRFDRFMVANAIGTNRKLRRLPVAQRWVYVAGVLAIASQSPLRGALLIADDEPATAEDIAQEATVKVADARAALSSFRKLGMLEVDENGIEWVHDWDAMNPSPKPSDTPAAARERKRRQRDRERGAKRDNGVTSRDCHAPEVEVEEQQPPQPPASGGSNALRVVDEFAPAKPATKRRTDIAEYDAAIAEWTARHFPNSTDPRGVAAIVTDASAAGPGSQRRPVTAADVEAFARRRGPTWTALLGLHDNTPIEGAA